MSTDPQELQEALAVNSGGQRINPFDLDVVKVPSAGMTIWTIPDITGEINDKALEGIVILQRTVRSWWEASIEDSGGGSPPSCSSQDGIWGTGTPAGHPDLTDASGQAFGYEMFDADGNAVGRPSGQRYACEACPLARFGSSPKGGGQACKQNRLLFLLTPESSLPLVLKVPPSSLKPIQSFMLRLSGKGIPYYGAVLSFGLVKRQNAAKIDYSEIVPSFVSKLSTEETARMKAVHESLKPVLAAAEFEAD